MCLTKLGAIGGAAVMLIGACGGMPHGAALPSPSGPVVTHYLGSPPDAQVIPAPSGLGPLDAAVWAASGEIAVVAWGSSGCPRLPTKIEVATSNSIEITMAEIAVPEGVTCSADSKPTTSVVRVPDGITSGETLLVKMSDGAFSATVSLVPQNSGG